MALYEGLKRGVPENGAPARRPLPVGLGQGGGLGRGLGSGLGSGLASGLASGAGQGWRTGSGSGPGAGSGQGAGSVSAPASLRSLSAARPMAQALRPAKGDAAEPASRALRVHTGEEGESAPFMDRLLGEGSAHTLGRAVGTALGALQGSGKGPGAGSGSGSGKAKGGEGRQQGPKQGPAAWSSRRMQAVGAGESHLPQGRKGLGRLLLVAIGLAWAVAALRPWQKAGTLKADLSALFTVPSSIRGEAGQAREARPEAAPDGQGAATAAQIQAAAQAQAQDAAKLAALPFQAGTGRALGLWQDGYGRWWAVDAAEALAPCKDPQAPEYLGLPELRGVAAHSEAWRGGRRSVLSLPPDRLKDLLPLDPALSSEVRAVEFQDPSQPVVVTHEGTRCLLGEGDWGEKQRRLAMVLADLGARKRHAGSIDLRFDSTAVVR